MDIKIRWMIKADTEDVISIHNQSFNYKINEISLAKELQKAGNIGMVAENRNTITGYMLYHLGTNKIILNALAVQYDYRRMGVGTKLINKLMSKIGPSNQRNGIIVSVHETNLPAQLFLRNCGFMCYEIDYDNDMYVFGRYE